MKNKTIKKAVILAGGKGKRLAKITKNIPKSLVKIGNKSVIEHQIILLKKYGIKKIWILLGHLGNQIKEYLGDGKKWEVDINYRQEENLLGTAGAIKTLENEIKEDFLLFSGDVMLNFNVLKFINWHEQKKEKIGSIIVHPNDHPFDSDLVELDKTGKIIYLLKRPHPQGMNFDGINLSIASVFIFSPKVFKYILKNKKCDIEKDVMPLILESRGKIYAYNSPEYFKDMGTPQRLKEVILDYASGRIFKKNRKNI